MLDYINSSITLVVAAFLLLTSLDIFGRAGTPDRTNALLVCSQLRHLFHFSAQRPAFHGTSVLQKSNCSSQLLLLRVFL